MWTRSLPLVALLAGALALAPGLAPALAPDDPPQTAPPPSRAAERGVPLSTPTVFYDAQTHQKILDAAAVGMAYNVVTNERVPLPAGDYIQPGRPLFLPDDTCTTGFIVTGSNGYGATTAAHCVDDGDRVTTPARSNPNVFIGFGNVTQKGKPNHPKVGTAILEGNESRPQADWAIIEIDASREQHVHPGVWGTRGPTGGAYQVPHHVNATPAAGWVWPMPVQHIVQPGVNRSIPEHTERVIVAQQSVATGLLVEEVRNAYFCECAASSGDSGGPVLVPAPGSPAGAALGLISEGLTRTPTYVGGLSDYVLDLLGPNKIENVKDTAREDRGIHELAAITPMTNVLEQADGYDRVVTVGPTSLPEPCATAQFDPDQTPTENAWDVWRCYHEKPDPTVQNRDDGTCAVYDDEDGDRTFDSDETGVAPWCPNPKVRVGEHQTVVYDDKDDDGRIDDGEVIWTSPEYVGIYPPPDLTSSDRAGSTTGERS